MVKRQKNPLNRRYLRELKEDAGKYLVIFILLVLSISLVSGFLVADESMLKTYDESFDRYNVENGRFISEKRLNLTQRRSVEKFGVTVYENFYTETKLDNHSTLRIFAIRDHVNLVCLMDGKMPRKADEIALDRMYADNNGLGIGDTVSNGAHVLTVTGLVALSDYSALFQNNSDSMFNAVDFGVAIVTQELFDTFGKDALIYNYAWKYDTDPADLIMERDVSEHLKSSLNSVIHLEDFVPRYLNQAIIFTGEDMGSDRQMMQVLLYIIIVIIAFVFAVTTAGTVAKEAGVIGTLRASGYTRKELVRHYMTLPMTVTMISAVIGNILGYTVIKDYCAAAYYGSYSLPAYVTVWSARAFFDTTVVPIVIVMLISWLVLRQKLSLPALKFLRHDLSRRHQKRAVYLAHRLPFMQRFRTRILLQNLSSYITLFIGILFADVLLIFGLGMPALLEHYQQTMPETMLANYQYILQVPSDMDDEGHRLESLVHSIDFLHAVSTDNESAERFTAYSLTIQKSEETVIDTVMVYGVDSDSRYVTNEFDDEDVYVSGSMAEKYGLSVGSSITLFEKYENKSYDFTVTGIYPYEGTLSLFMSRNHCNRVFNLGADAFAGYFSDTPLTDIDRKYIGSVIDYDSLTAICRQLDVSMGSIMKLVDGFAVIMFVVLMYLLSKNIIEKNARSISVTKILGYTGGEISRLYIIATLIAVIVSLIAALPLTYKLFSILFVEMISRKMSGWLPLWLPAGIYRTMFLLGLGSYAVISLAEYRKIHKVPMHEALKNVE